MWNSQEKGIADWDIFNEHMRILSKAVEDAAEVDVRPIHLKASIQYIEVRLDRKGGLNLFLAGLRDGNQNHMREGLKLIKKHLGISC